MSPRFLADLSGLSGRASRLRCPGRAQHYGIELGMLASVNRCAHPVNVRNLWWRQSLWLCTSCAKGSTPRHMPFTSCAQDSTPRHAIDRVHMRAFLVSDMYGRVFMPLPEVSGIRAAQNIVALKRTEHSRGPVRFSESRICEFESKTTLPQSIGNPNALEKQQLQLLLLSRACF